LSSYLLYIFGLFVIFVSRVFELELKWIKGWVKGLWREGERGWNDASTPLQS